MEDKLPAVDVRAKERSLVPWHHGMSYQTWKVNKICLSEQEIYFYFSSVTIILFSLVTIDIFNPNEYNVFALYISDQLCPPPYSAILIYIQSSS